MWLKWLPWRLVISRWARAQGFIDPIVLLARVRSFAQPSEVQEPIELMRAGVIFQARGLINTRVIQHNLDWIWPYWIERQFNPTDVSFVPRAFSLTHINLTHRNWTALGQPDCPYLPLVDPRGLLMPFLDGWSLDAWVLPDEGPRLLPSRLREADQHYVPGEALAIATHSQGVGTSLANVADVTWRQDGPVCRMRLRATADPGGWLAVAVRPANPEGISFIQHLDWDAARGTLTVNQQETLTLDPRPERMCMSTYAHGDVAQFLPDESARDRVHCEVGVATGAALFRLAPGAPRDVAIHVPLSGASHHPAEPPENPPPGALTPVAWREALAGLCTVDIPDEWMQRLFAYAVRNLVLFSPRDVYPGPYTSKRFWFRDAAFILHALLVVGAHQRVRRTLQRYPARQMRDGFFRSQEGEWDSNGQALWILDAYRRLAGAALPDEWLQAMVKGAEWVHNKRVPRRPETPHAGLLPAGFSAEHLGPNDFYFWDDFWAVGGLRAAADSLEAAGRGAPAARARAEADDLLANVEHILARTAARRPRPGVPASPYRRMDAGAIGSLAVGYPLQLWAPRDPRLLATADFLWRHCRVNGGFFQDMIHSGINTYLSLQLAQVLLRAADDRQVELVRTLARLATPTGQWPEAIHPHTGGGCMGDGQHIWAAAEWVLMMRNMFVREEGAELVVGAGLPADWLATPRPLRCGPTATTWGTLTLELTPGERDVAVRWEAQWRAGPPPLALRLRGCEPRNVPGGDGSARVPRQAVLAEART